MRIDAATAEVLRGLAETGARALVLKGPAVAAWLYGDGARRPYMDSDLLLRPGDEPAAEAVLRKLGFVPRFDQSAMPGWWQEHGSEWSRAQDGVLVDLHRSLPGVGVDAATAWTVLTQRTHPVSVAGFETPALSLPGRALHVSLHAAQHGSGWGKGIADLERALEVGDRTVWEEAARLADRLEATDAFAAGLRLVPAGRELADRLGLPVGDAVDVALRATTAPPVALGIEQLATARGWRARVTILVRKAFPPPEFIRHWDPRAGESAARLVLAYARRPFWLLRHAPAGIRAWWRVRRQVRR